MVPLETENGSVAIKIESDEKSQLDSLVTVNKVTNSTVTKITGY
jgi:hypothetical protein